MSFHQSFRQAFLVAAGGVALSIAAAGAAAAQQCPDWQLGGIPISTDSDTAWVPQQYPLFAGGSLDVSGCPAFQGVGRVTPAPNFTLQYDALTHGRDLEFRVATDCDTTLLVNDSSAGWHFNDDADGTLQPRLRLPAAASGQYDIWVGTFSTTSCQATLVVETFPPAGGTGGGTGGATPPAPVCPDWALGGAEINLALGGSDSRQVVAGGGVDLFNNQCDLQAHGYVAEAPDFSLYFDPQGQVATLNISVQGQCDTTLLVNDPTTAWLFDDDTNEMQPALTIGDAQAGRYDIWVGTYGPATCPSTINISATAPAPTPPVSPQGK